VPEVNFDDADAFSASDGHHGVLVLHGFTGSPRSVRPLAEAFADAGFSVELPVLPGHASTPEELATQTFADFAQAAQGAFSALAARTDRTIVVGHSMGGALALFLALSNADVAGLVLINPLVAPPAASFMALLDGAIASGTTMLPTVGGDVKRSDVATGGYHATPIAPLRSLFEALPPLSERLPDVVCPTLLFSSRIDHVVPIESSDLVEERLGGPVERVMLENSYHVATLDFDAAEIEDRSVAFATKLCAA